jgi:hypothetical protein
LGVSGIFFSKFCAQVSKRTSRKVGSTYQLLKNALVQSPLLRPAVPELLVVVLQALPVGSELREAVLVDVLDAAMSVSVAPSHLYLLESHTR